MKALILAAGYATRLYPLTKNLPKQLLQVGEKKMVEHIIHKIEEVEDIDEIIIVTNNKYHPQFLEWEKEFYSEKPITLINNGTNTNEERLGAVGDMHFAVNKQDIDDDLLIVGGDNLFEFSLMSIMNMFREKEAPVVAARDLGDPSRLAKKFGTIEIDDDMKIVGFEEKPEKPKSALASTCIYLYTKEDIIELEKLIGEGKKPDNTGDFLRHILDKRHVYCYSFSEKWFDIGSPEELKEVNRIYGGDDGPSA